MRFDATLQNGQELSTDASSIEDALEFLERHYGKGRVKSIRCYDPPLTVSRNATLATAIREAQSDSRAWLAQRKYPQPQAAEGPNIHDLLDQAREGGDR